MGILTFVGLAYSHLLMGILLSEQMKVFKKAFIYYVYENNTGVLTNHWTKERLVSTQYFYHVDS